MKSTSFKTKIVLLPLVFILAVTLLTSLYYINVLQNYHKANIENFIEEYNKRQYAKIKDEVDRVIDFLEYATTYKGKLAEVEKKVLDRVNHIDMTSAPYMFILKLLEPSGGKDFARIIFYNNRPEAIGKLISDDKVDQDNKLFLQEVLKDIQQQGFSYMVYKHAKPNQESINNKLTLFYLYEPLQWIITSSVFLDEVCETIEKKELELQNQIRRTIIVSLLFVFTFSLLVLVIFYRISSRIYQKLEDRTQKLLNSEKLLKQAQEIAKIGHWELSLESNELYWSDEIFKIFDIDSDKFQATYEAFVERIHPDDRRLVSQAYLASVDKKSPYNVKHRIVLKSGVEKWVREKGITHYNKTGKPILSVGTVQDITEAKQQQEVQLQLSQQKEQLNKFESLKTMAGAIAHRFNNAMMVVNGNLELVAATLPDKSEGYQMISDATQAAKGATQVGSMMLSYVGQQPRKLIDISIETLVKEGITALSSLLLASITLKLTPPVQDLYCSIDRLQIKEVIESLMTNAIESLGDGAGTIEITFGTEYFTVDSFPVPFQNENLHDGMYTYCQIKDSGHGISPQDLSRIFEPFYTTRFVGRGLGLALTVGIMQSHHGALTVESVLDKGTTVRLLLPVLSAAQQTTPADDVVQSENVQLSGNILLADDEEMVLGIGRKMLEVLGFTVHTAISGQEAVDKIRKNDIDFCAVVLDISMPEMDGIEAMNVIRKINPALPILLSSGHSEDDFSFTEELEEKPDGFLAKPFQVSGLRNSLEALLS
jgi:PAS domain S-box-containing protein